MPENIMRRLEVKVPDGNGGYTTEVVQLDYLENIAGKPLVFLNEADLPETGNPNYIYIILDKKRIKFYDGSGYQTISSDSIWQACTTTQEGYISAASENRMLVTKNGATIPTWETFTIDGGSATNNFAITD